MNITVTIQASPELLNVLNGLAVALDQRTKGIAEAQAPQQQAPVQPVTPPTMQQPVITPTMQQPVITPTAPVQQVQQPTYPQQQQAPVQQAPQQQATQQTAPVQGMVPTTTQSYTMEQLAVAATQLVDAGRVNELHSLLAQFGIQALTALPKEQYGAFATALRQMGAKI